MIRRDVFTQLALPGSTGTVKKKVVPEPGVLSSQIRPPIISTNRFEMVSPSPVPPYLRVVVPSACEKASNMCCCFEAGTPMPVSRTEACTDPTHQEHLV